MPTQSKKISPYGSHKFSTINEYHSTFSEDIQEKLSQLRKTIHDAAPQSIETISYNMPAFKQQQVLVYYAAYKNHIGFYPTASPIIFFKEDLKKYTTSKGAIQFPLNEKIPIALIKKIVKFRVNEINEKALLKAKK
jgi:uncharacterized protein YdhG (YjbR/CyaY superfamily)